VSLCAHDNWKSAVEKSILEQGHVGCYIRRIAKKPETKLPAEPTAVRTLLDHALYYVDPVHAVELSFLGAAGKVSLGELADLPPLSHEDCLNDFERADLRIAVADVTSPDLRNTPFRVARAIGEYVQQIEFGYHVRRLANPRLQTLLQGQEPNPAPHPIA
jgi:ribosomal protein S12 methylthiotransferase accessory factor